MSAPMSETAQRDVSRDALDEARADLTRLKEEVATAMTVLAPNVPESGLVDACRQVKQVAISEADNSDMALAALERLKEGLATLEQEMRALGMGWLKWADRLAALRGGQ